MSRFAMDTVYDRQQLHKDAAADGLKPGNATAGIVEVGGELCIFWNPFRKFYANRWIDEPREFIYSGEGSTGPMGYTAGNRNLIDAEESDRRVTVFYKMERAGSKWKCLGGFRVVEHNPGVSVDSSGTPRPDLRFRLVALEAPSKAVTLPKVAAPSVPPLPDEDSLWAAVEGGVKRNGSKRQRGMQRSKDKRQSDPMKSLYVRRRAVDFGGVCESCLVAQGWVREDGYPHLQAHHIEADVDLVDWIGAVCGTCHDRLHHGTDRVKRAEELRQTVKGRQIKMGRPTYELTGLPMPSSNT